MHMIYDDATLAVLGDTTSAQRDLIDRIVADARASDLWDLTCIVVVEDHDTAQDWERVLGYPPSTGPLDGDGQAYWAWLEQHGDLTELLVTAGDEGFAWFILIPNGWFDAHIGRR